MAKKNENETLNAETTTTTTAPVIEISEKIDLQNYLDSLSLTRAERMYYERTYGLVRILKTYDEWRKEIKLVH